MEIDIKKREWIKERILNLGEIDGEYIIKHGESFNSRLRLAWYTNLGRYIFLRFFPVKYDTPKDESDFFSSDEYWIIEGLKEGIHKDVDYKRLSIVIPKEDMNKLKTVFGNVLKQCMCYSEMGKSIVSDIRRRR